jgi:alkanesulfonate monooxygenase SsuD/methylene tetrahydromethanopterin reductase-like flavin-dependent oxidoreductase (luciferase family)
MEFGIQIEPQFGYSYGDVLNISQSATKCGFSTLWFSDHFMLDKNAIDRVLLDPWLLMASLVRDNKTVKVGNLVACNSYRPPPLHAKMAATLDVLSEGRLEFGIGAGWKEIEYGAYGYPFPMAAERIEQLAESVQIIKGIWSNDKYTFSGKHYQVRDIVSFPKPVQKPRPTIWIGSMKGGRKMLQLTAEHGDGINLSWSFAPAQCRAIFDELDNLGELYGRKPGTIKRSLGLWTRCFESEQEMASAIAEDAAKRNLSVEAYQKRIESSLWGTPSALADKIREYNKLGVTHTILMLPHMNEIEQIELLGSKVLPNV